MQGYPFANSISNTSEDRGLSACHDLSFKQESDTEDGRKQTLRMVREVG